MKKSYYTDATLNHVLGFFAQGLAAGRITAEELIDIQKTPCLRIVVENVYKFANEDRKPSAGDSSRYANIIAEAFMRDYIVDPMDYGLDKPILPELLDRFKSDLNDYDFSSLVRDPVFSPDTWCDENHETFEYGAPGE